MRVNFVSLIVLIYFMDNRSSNKKPRLTFLSLRGRINHMIIRTQQEDLTSNLQQQAFFNPVFCHPKKC
jgi:hypothetical protein